MQQLDCFADLTAPLTQLRATQPTDAAIFRAPSGDLYTLSFPHPFQHSGWDLKFKIEDLTKLGVDGKEAFDQNVIGVLQELSQLHPFFKHAIEARNRNGYHFKIFDPRDPELGDNVKLQLLNGASACTSVLNKCVYFVIKTDMAATVTMSKKDFVATLAYELVHVIKSRTYSRYEDETEAFKNIKSIVDEEMSGKKSLSNAEALLFQVAEQELLGRCVSENIAALCDDDQAKVDRGYFASDSFKNRHANYLMHVFETMWGRGAIEAIKNSKSTRPEILSDAELKIFVARLSRNIRESGCGEHIVEELKSWGFSFAQK